MSHAASSSPGSPRRSRSARFRSRRRRPTTLPATTSVGQPVTSRAGSRRPLERQTLRLRRESGVQRSASRHRSHPPRAHRRLLGPAPRARRRGQRPACRRWLGRAQGRAPPDRGDDRSRDAASRRRLIPDWRHRPTPAPSRDPDRPLTALSTACLRIESMTDKTRIKIAAAVTALFLAGISTVGLAARSDSPQKTAVSDAAAPAVQPPTTAKSSVASLHAVLDRGRELRERGGVLERRAGRLRRRGLWGGEDHD